MTKRNRKKVKVNDDLTIVYKPIPPLAFSAIQTTYNKQFPKPEHPTYEFEAAGDVTVVEKHDETTIDPKNPEEVKMWDTYTSSMQEWQTGLTERLMTLTLLEGMIIEASDNLREKWDRKLKRYHGDISELDDEDMQLLYIQTFIFTDKDSIDNATKLIMALTGVSEADLESAEQLFPD